VSIVAIFSSLLRSDPEPRDASDVVLIDPGLRDWLSPQGIADLEDFFLELGAQEELEEPVTLSVIPPDGDLVPTAKGRIGSEGV
jgi:hypothetical protein